MEELLKIDNIFTSYGNRHILQGISMILTPGEKVFIIGPNGAGKTTLLKTIVGLLPSLKGKIYFFGEELSKISVRARIDKGIGYLLQTANIVPGLTVEENLALGGYYLKKDDFKKQTEKVLDSMNFLKRKLKLRAGLLSGGERQALAISMVLMRSPKLLLLDEPSAGLAPKAAKEIIETVTNIQDSFRVDTVCIVEHNLKLALKWASKVVVLVQGRIALFSENPEILMEKPEELEKYFFAI